MPKFNVAKNSFLAGELSPKLEGRIDLPIYQQGVRQLRNMIPMLTGGAIKRPGSKYIATTPLDEMGGNAYTALIPFVYSETDAYAVLINGYLDTSIYRNTGAVCVLTGGFVGAYGLNNFDPYTIQYAQSADVLYLANKDIRPVSLTRTGATTFTMADFLTLPANTAAKFVALRLPYRDPNATTVTMTPSATTGTNKTLTASSAFFDSLQAGAYFKVTHGSTTGVCKINFVTSSTVANIDIIIDFGAITASADWEESAWSDYRGWPRTVSFFEGRLIYGGNASQPDTFWCSRIGAYTTFMQKKLAQDATTDVSGLKYYGALSSDDACSFTIASQEVNTINWMASLRTYLIGTLGAEYVARAGSDRTISATNISVIPNSGFGSSYLPAKKVNQDAVFFSPDQRKLIRYEYQFNQDSYKPTNLNELADHIVSQGALSFSANLYQFRQIAYQNSRSALWTMSILGLSSEQSFAGVTLDKDKNITAWSHHKLGGVFTNTSVDYAPVCMGLCTLPASDGQGDELWLAVARTVNGATFTSLEKIGHDFLGEMDKFVSGDLAPFVDCYATSNPGSAQLVHSGWSHLIGQTVAIVADGQYVGTKVVDGSGHITLDVAAQYVIAGLPYSPLIKTMRVEAGSVLGVAQGSMMQIDRLVVRVDRSLGLKYGPDENNLLPFDFRTLPDNLTLALDQPLPLYSGDLNIEFPGPQTTDPRVVITQDEPLPLTVLALFIRGDLHEQ
jgi:hypothetical protein